MIMLYYKFVDSEKLETQTSTTWKGADFFI